MQGPFREGDLLGIDHKGRTFLATYVSDKGTDVLVSPIPANVTYYTVSKRDIVSRWRLSKGKLPSANRNGNLSYG